MAKTTQPKKEDVVRNEHRQFEGEVVSTKEQKTIHVLVKRIAMHAKYHKHYTTSKKYAVHDEAGKAEVGQWVQFEECRPFSKTKRWRLTNIVK